MNSVERLIYMANQIATNLATEPDPVEATSTHIRLFWDPRMKRLLLEHGEEGLSVIAAAAVQQLAIARDSV